MNSPTRLLTSIVPPCCWVRMSRLIDSPRPVTSPVGLVVKKSWNSFSLRTGYEATISSAATTALA